MITGVAGARPDHPITRRKRTLAVEMPQFLRGTPHRFPNNEPRYGAAEPCRRLCADCREEIGLCATEAGLGALLILVAGDSAHPNCAGDLAVDHDWHPAGRGEDTRQSGRRWSAL